MKGILLTSKSLTFAQKMKSILNSGGIIADIVRPDVEITQNNCAYAVIIQQSFLPEAVEMLLNKAFILLKDKYYPQLTRCKKLSSKLEDMLEGV